MSLWNAIKESARDANEAAHAQRLHDDLSTTLRLVDGMPDHIKASVLTTYLEMRHRIMGDMDNWSRDGALKIAKGMFTRARALKDLNKKDSYALALAALWLESGQRPHPQALAVHAYLDTVAKELST